jgi:hypothetical protein
MTQDKQAGQKHQKNFMLEHQKYENYLCQK